MSPAEPGAALRALLEDAVARGVTPGAVALVADGGAVVEQLAVGRAQVTPSPEPMALDTPFDVASLTKPLVTAALALALEDELGLSPGRPARSLLPELDTLAHADVTLRHLLTHSAGLPAWRPLFLRGESAPDYLKVLRDEALVDLPGRRAVYSDPSYMAAGEMVARAAGAPLDRLFREILAAPLGLEAAFRPGPETARRCAATEDGQVYERALAGAEAEGYDGFREGVIRGEVHDHHAWVAGGVLGSAGLFATAADLHRLALEVLGAGEGLLPERARARMRAPGPAAAGEARSEGWALNRAGEGSCGPALEDGALGHTGFTGASLWIEPGRGRIYVLLTNRIHPRVREGEMPALRREFHRLAAEL